MTRTVHFADAFWGEDICSTAGFDSIVKRMKDGNATCSRVAVFIKQRASIENEYANRLQKLAKSTDFTSEEPGLLRSSLDAARFSLDKIADEHFNCSKQLTECSERLNMFTDKQKTERQQEEEVMKKSITRKYSLYKKTLDAKKQYYQRAREAELKEEGMAKARLNKTNIPTKEWDNLCRTNEKAKQECSKADQQYKELIKQLDEARDQWQRDMTRFCEFCERQDFNRLKSLQNELWTQCNIISQTCVDVDNQCEAVRLSLEKMIYEADISSFVELHQTGISKPAPVIYEPYMSAMTQNGSDSVSSSASNTKPQRPSVTSQTSSASTSSSPDVLLPGKVTRGQVVNTGPRLHASQTPLVVDPGRPQGSASKDYNNTISTTKQNVHTNVRSLPVAPVSRSHPDEVAQTLPKATPRQNPPQSPGPLVIGGQGISVAEAATRNKAGKYEFEVKSPPLKPPGTNNKSTTLPRNYNNDTSSRL